MIRLRHSILPLFLALLATGAPGRAAVLEEVGGTVDASPVDQDRWRRVSVGEELAPGEELRTGPQGRAVLSQGEREVEVSRRTRLRWEGAHQLRILQGRLAVSQPAGTTPLEIQAPHTRGTLSGGRLRLRVRDDRDSWRSLEGGVEVSPRSEGSTVAIPGGRQVDGGPAGLEPSRAIPADRMGRGGERRGERRASEEILREDLRWQDTLEKLLTASRRLVRRAEKEQANPGEQTFQQLEELGAALQAAQVRIEAMSEQRALGTRGTSRSAAQLRSRAQRALETHESLYSRLQRLRSPGPLGGPGAVGPPEVEASPTGRPDSGVALARIEEATRFLHRYQQALRRFLRVLGRLVRQPPAAVPRGDGSRIQGRIVGGYRQAERLVHQARAEVQRVPRQDRTPQVTQRHQALQRQWRLVGSQFRRGQELARRVRAKSGG